MGGLSPEFLQKLVQNPGIGQGILLGQQKKQRGLERRQDFFESQSQFRNLKEGAVVPPELQGQADIANLFGQRTSATAGGAAIGADLAAAFTAQGLDVTADMTLAHVDSLRKLQSAQQSAALRTSQQQIQLGGQQINIAKFTFDDIQLEKQKDINETKLRDPGAVQAKLVQNKGLDDILKFKRFPSQDWNKLFTGKKREEIVQVIQQQFPQATPLHVQYFVNQILRNKRQYGIK